MTLSLCMIVKNEEDVLERCLTSTGDLFDEIIIVDTGSSDKTVEIAKKFTNKVYFFKWINDFSAARNYSFSFATCDFIMWLDADDVIPEEELIKLKELKSKLTYDTNVVMLKYAISFDEHNKPTFSYYRERIFNRRDNFKWEDCVHEAITPRGNILYSDITIHHKKIKPSPAGRNLKIYENMKKQKIPFKPRQMFYYARELYFNGKYKKAVSAFKQFLKTQNGFKENYIEACSNLSRCYLNLNEIEKAKQILFYSFIYDTPRAEILCEIGNIYCNERNYNTAIFYYKLALEQTPNYKSGAFILEDCYNFIPAIQLCVCYYYLGDLEKTLYYHNLSKTLKPLDPAVINNENFFKSLKK